MSASSLAFQETSVKECHRPRTSAEFLYTETGIRHGQATAEKAFTIERDNRQWIIRTDRGHPGHQGLRVSHQARHWLGTDANGMDILTRMMYGGRISLMIGFIVVIIEMIIGVIVLGGIAGYFGKWIDNLLMRIVDIFNSIPSIPIIIIIGAVMDGLRVDPQIRMVYLMLILGILGWPGIARLVRGQILSLREQEFMVAAEATGLSVYRRIFKHLVPNVIPQLIVIATMSLGGIILTESVLSFLRPRRQVSVRVLGQHHQRSQQRPCHDQLLVCLDSGRLLYPDHRAGLQLHRRRPARRI
jgi:peptide/nickel transport system permease protein